MENQEVSASSSLKTLHPFIDKEGLLRGEGTLQQFSLPYQTMQQKVLPLNISSQIGCVSRAHKNSPCWATKSNSITTREILDTKGKELVENSHSSVPNLPQIQGSSNTTDNGRVAISTSTIFEAIPHYKCGPCWTDINQIGTTTKQTITKVYIAMVVCFLTRAVNTEIVTSFSTEVFLAALRRFIARQEKPRTICSDNVPNYKVLPTNFMQSTKCFNPLHRWQQYRTSWPLKDANGYSMHQIELTSEDYGKQQ